MRRVKERLAPHLVPREQRFHHARVCFSTAVEHRERAIGVAKEPEHRRHAVMGAAQPRGNFDARGGQRIGHHHDLSIGKQQGFGRARDMTAIRQNLVRDFRLQRRKRQFDPFGVVGKAGAGEHMDRSGFKTRQSRRSFLGNSAKLCRLLANRHEHLRPPQYVGIGEYQTAVREQHQQPTRDDLWEPCRFAVACVAFKPFGDELNT